MSFERIQKLGMGFKQQLQTLSDDKVICMEESCRLSAKQGLKKHRFEKYANGRGAKLPKHWWEFAEKHKDLCYKFSVGKRSSNRVYMDVCWSNETPNFDTFKERWKELNTYITKGCYDDPYFSD